VASGILDGIMVGVATLEQVLSRFAREGELYEPLPGGRVRCVACGHRCLVPSGQRGICKVRWNADGRLMVPAGYVAGLQLDRIEKKPVFHAYRGLIHLPHHRQQRRDLGQQAPRERPAPVG
jgi:pyruvate formate lyase activating enzyme